MRALLAIFFLLPVVGWGQETIVFGNDTLDLPLRYYSLKESHVDGNRVLMVRVDPFGTDSFVNEPIDVPIDTVVPIKKYIKPLFCTDLETGISVDCGSHKTDSTLRCSKFYGQISKTALLNLLKKNSAVRNYNTPISACYISSFTITDSLKITDTHPKEFEKLEEIISQLKPGDYYGVNGLACKHGLEYGYYPLWEIILNGVYWEIAENPPQGER